MTEPIAKHSFRGAKLLQTALIGNPPSFSRASNGTHTDSAGVLQRLLGARNQTATDFFKSGGVVPTFAESFPKTIVGKMRINTNGVAQYIFNITSTVQFETDQYISIEQTTANELRVVFRSSASTPNVTTSGNALADNAWHSFAYVERSSTDRELYFDGSSVDTDTFDSSPSLLNTVSAGVLARFTDTNSAGDADLSDVAIYNRELSTAELALISGGTIRPDQVSGAGPQHWWKFGETEGPVRDSGSVGGITLTDTSDPTYVADTPGLARLGGAIATTTQTDPGEFLLVNLLNELHSQNTPLPYTVNQSMGFFSRSWALDFDSWSEFTGGTASAVYSGGSDNDDASPTVDLGELAASDRVFVNTGSLALVNGREYVFSVDVSNVVGQTTIKWQGGGSLSGTTSLDILEADGDGRYAFRFVSDGTIGNFRIGPGANNVNPGPGSRGCRFANPMLEDVTDTPDSKFCDYTPRITVLTSHPANDLVSGHSGEVVPGAPVSYPANSNPYAFGIFIGDSFSNDYDSEWPGRLQSSYRGLADLSAANAGALSFGQGASRVLGFGLSGQTLTDQTNSIGRGLTAELAASSYPYTFAIIQGGVNDISGNNSAEDIQAAVEGMVAELRAYGVRHIDIMKVAPWEGHMSHNGTKQIQQDAYNDWLDTYATANSDIGVIDIFKLLEDPADDDALLAFYNFDLLHPSAEGHRVIRQAVLARQRSQTRSTAWSNKGVLIEPAETNLVLHTEDFDDAAWVKTAGGLVTSKYGLAPDGSMRADRIRDENAGTQDNIQQTISQSSNTNPHVISLYVQKDADETRFPELLLQFNTGGVTTSYHLRMNTKTGAVDTSIGSAPTSAGAIDVGEFWRFWMVAPSVTGNTNILIAISPAKAASAIDAAADNAAVGSIVAFGLNLCVGSFVTSYIPADDAAAPRVIDNLSIAHSQNSPFTAVVKGTAPIDDDGTDQVLWQIDDGSVVDRVRIVRRSGVLHVIFTTASTDVADLNLGSVTDLSDFEVAFRSADADFAASLNGTTIVPHGAGTAPDGLTTMRIGHDHAPTHHWSGWVSESRVFDSAEDNEFLQNPPLFFDGIGSAGFLQNVGKMVS